MAISGEDIIITAVEGGINYWANVTSYDSEYGRADITDIESGEDYELEPQKVEAAIHRALELYPDTDAGRYIKKAIASGDPGHIDAEAADVIVQVSMFDQIIYG